MAASWLIDTTTGGRDEALDDDVWFQQPPGKGPLAEVITISGQSGEPLDGDVLVSIISVTPPVPAGVRLEVVPPGRANGAKVTLTASNARILGGQHPRILELQVQSVRGGEMRDVRAFENIAPGDAEVIAYIPDNTPRPFYTVVIEVTDWGPNGGGLLGTERRTYVFGLQKDYTPNRDALVAAVNARRRG